MQLWETSRTGDSCTRFWDINNNLVAMDDFVGKRVPLRCYLQADKAVVLQWPMPFRKEDGSKNTVADLLEECTREARDRSMTILPKEAILHGIVLPPDASLAQLSLHLVYPDNFLHIVITT